MSGKRPSLPPFSLRLTFEERAALEKAAGDMPLGAYVRERIFDGSRPARRTRNKRPTKDQKELARLFALLGQSRVASNLNQLARAANSGSLVMTPDAEAELKQACKDIRFMRMTLMRALGLYPEDDGS